MDHQHKDSNMANRRKLLKASAGLPLVATLMPNAAAAMSSVTCHGDYSNKKFQENGDSWDGDDAVRVIVDVWKTQGGGSMGGEVLFRLPPNFPTTVEEISALATADDDAKLEASNLGDPLAVGETLYDKNGNPHLVVDEDERDRINGLYHTQCALLVLFQADGMGGVTLAGLYPLKHEEDPEYFGASASCLASIVQSNNGAQL